MTAIKRVLVVDDFPDAAAATMMLLELRGFECETATSGREALEKFDSFDPDLAILDIGLPDISGFEIARIIRKRVSSHPIHLCAVTGWADETTRARAFEAGFDQHVIKPTDLAKIDAIVRGAGVSV